MANYWKPVKLIAVEGTQEWDLWTTIADLATANTAGQITDAPDGVRKGDKINVKTGCTGVTTPALRAGFTAQADAMATADAASGALDLSDGTALSTDSD